MYSANDMQFHEEAMLQHIQSQRSYDWAALSNKPGQGCAPCRAANAVLYAVIMHTMMVSAP